MAGLVSLSGVMRAKHLIRASRCVLYVTFLAQDGRGFGADSSSYRHDKINASPHTRDYCDLLKVQSLFHFLEYRVHVGLSKRQKQGMILGTKAREYAYI